MICYMEKIKRVWFSDSRIYIETSDDKVLSRPLEAFPILKEATPAQREDYKIGRFGDDIRWDAIDEDIHISSFHHEEEPVEDNEVAQMFRHFPWLNISEVAHQMGIHKTLLSSYIYGMKKPGPERMQLIRNTLRMMGREMMAV